MLFAHLVAHTHWDREWYQPFVRFRQRLVALVDELLDDPPAPNETFLLDGQAVILEDYLAIRPEREEELSGLLWSGRLEAGPWYVLADELIPGGEALLRNLQLGRRVLRRYHAESPPVLYCPDSFGHPAALPAVAAGFGVPLIVLWRGYGSRRWPRTDTFIWRGPSGEQAVVFHLPPNGYEFGSDLPEDGDSSRERWRRMREILADRAATGVVMVQNGADHHARQRGQRQAVEALGRAAIDTGDALRPSGLRAFAEDLLQRVRGRALPEVAGELRDSYGYTWTLQGTFSSRTGQKRANARAERLLVRDAEPWAALARQRGAPSRIPLLVAAWRTLLQAHPHDTLCGCSIDAVAAAMDRRIADVVAQGTGIRDDALADLVGHDADSVRERPEDWRPIVLVRNRAPRPRGGVAIVEMAQCLAHVPVGPGSAPVRGPVPDLPPPLELLDGRSLQVLGTSMRYDRLESPRHYPDNDLVAVTRAAVWVEDVPPYGIAALPLGEAGHSSKNGSPSRMLPDGEHPVAPAHPVRADGLSLDNGIVRVAVDSRGHVRVESAADNRRIPDLLTLVDLVDRGDLYTASIGAAASRTKIVDTLVTRTGPLIGELRFSCVLAGREHVSKRSRLTIHIILVAESPLIRVEVRGRNRLRDHRLQVAVGTDVRNGEIWADAAFGTVRRSPLVVPDEDRAMETPPPTAPLHRYVSIFGADRGATLISDGLAEYETRPGGAILVTLLRAVGELSRNDLPERPGHAGWPAPTPRAQCLGPHAARFALLLHGPRTAAVIDEIERAADDALLPLEGRTLRSALHAPAPVLGAELVGAGLAFSALKESENGEWTVARCVNMLDEPVAGLWRFGSPIVEARLARLDETPLQPLEVTDDGIAFGAPPRGAVTILVR